MTHDQLAESLAEHLRANTDSVVWTNMQMGPSGSARPDVYAIAKSYSKFSAAAFEVKVSAADLLRDLAAGKWVSYVKFSTTVCFAMAADLAKSHGNRVPLDCGLIVLGENGWRYRRRATYQRLGNLPRDAWLKLVIDGVEREAKRPRDRRARTEWMAERALAKAIGEHAAQQIGLLRTNPDCLVHELNRHAKEMDQLRALHTRVENEQYNKVQAARRAQEGQCSEYLECIARALGCEAQDTVDRLGLVCNLMTGVDWRDPIRKALDGMQAASQALGLVHALIRGAGAPRHRVLSDAECAALTRTMAALDDPTKHSDVEYGRAWVNCVISAIQQDSGQVTAAPAVATQVVEFGAAAQTRTGDLLITNQSELSPQSTQEQTLSEEQARAGAVEKGESDQGCAQTLQQGVTLD